MNSAYGNPVLGFAPPSASLAARFARSDLAARSTLAARSDLAALAARSAPAAAHSPALAATASTPAALPAPGAALPAATPTAGAVVGRLVASRTLALWPCPVSYRHIVLLCVWIGFCYPL
ncbi:MAG: hypothetical protein JEZ11_10430 [Desulfobacterales bacterium]|nr:hypothetical protein [Desulfobacterales bacterium]